MGKKFEQPSPEKWQAKKDEIITERERREVGEKEKQEEVKVLEEISKEQEKKVQMNKKKKMRVIAAIKEGQGMGSTLESLAKQYSDDREVMTALVTRQSWTFNQASDSLRNDAAFILKLMKVQPDILAYASVELQNEIYYRIHPEKRSQGASKAQEPQEE